MEQSSSLQDIQTIWTEIVAGIRAEVSADTFTRWFKDVQLAALDDRYLTLRVPNNIYQLWIESNYLPLLQTATMMALGTPRAVQFVYADDEPVKAPVSGEPAAPAPEAELEEEKEKESEAPAAAPTNGLNPRNTFESFVVGANNQFAHAACVAVAQSPGKTYNPLFFYGGVGLGKTHLMHAIGHQILGKKKGGKVL